MTTTRYVKNAWKWVVTDLAGIVQTNLDRLATNVQLAYVIDDAQQMTCDVKSDDIQINARTAADGAPLVSYGRRLIYGLRHEGGTPPWTCRYAGVITILQDEAASDEPISHLTAHDPWMWLRSMPVLNPDGSLLSSAGLVYTGKTGDYIAKDLIANAYAWIVAQFGATLPWNGYANDGSHLFVDISSGHFDTTDVIPTITFQQGCSVGEAWTQLCDTGSLDIVLTPRYAPSSHPGQLSVMNVYAQAGSEKDGATFGWDMFPRNLVGVDNLLDGTQLANWGQFYASSVAATFFDWMPSINAHGPYWLQKSYPSPSSADAVALVAEAEIVLRKAGKQTLMIDPAPEIAPDPFTEYFLGDTVSVVAGRINNDLGGTALRGELRDPASHHRIFGFVVDLADDQTETITNLLLTDQNAI